MDIDKVLARLQDAYENYPEDMRDDYIGRIVGNWLASTEDLILELRRVGMDDSQIAKILGLGN